MCLALDDDPGFRSGHVDHADVMRRFDQRRAREVQQRSADPRVVDMQMSVDHVESLSCQQGQDPGPQQYVKPELVTA